MSKNNPGNFIHNCDEKLIDIKLAKQGMEYVKLSKDKKFEICNFYIKTTKKDFLSNECDWKGVDSKKGLNKLEGLLLQKSGIQTFCILKSNTISETLQRMNLIEKICITHPRAVMKMDIKSIKYNEDGEFVIIARENRMECLLRHIRNSIAHNLLYVFKNKMILLEDKNEKDDITARILISDKTLYNWLKIIEKRK